MADSFDPLVRFRTSMAASMTEPSHGGSRTSHPDDGDDLEEDGAQLLKLIDEATHALTEDEHVAAGSFVVTANGSTASAVKLHGSPSASTVFQNQSLTSFGAAFAPPPPSTPPPTFAEAILTCGTPMMGASNTSPVPYAASLPAPPPPAQGPSEAMIVRNLRGVFLVQPVGKVNQTQQHASTPPLYAPPQYGQGASPPVSPLPSYALPPALPPMNFLGNSVQASHHSTATPQKKNASQSPPNYPAPPPYRSPAGK